MVRKKSRRRKRQEEDPMAGTTNLVDAMLVLALGFLIFAVIGWNLQSVIFSDMSPEDRLIAIVRRIRELKQEGKDVPSVFRSLLGRRGMNELNKLAADTQFETNLKSGGLSDEAVNNSEKLATSLTELKQNFVKMLSNNSTMITLVKMINNGVVAIAKHFGQNLNPNMNKDTENLTAVGAEFNRQYTSGNLNTRTVQKNLSPEEMADLILTAFKGGTVIWQN